MSVHPSLKSFEKTQAVLSDRAALFSLELSELTDEEVAAIEKDIARYEGFGVISARVIKLLTSEQDDQAPAMA